MKAKLGDVVKYQFLGYPKEGTITKVNDDNSYTVTDLSTKTNYPKAKFFKYIKDEKKQPAWVILDKTGKTKASEAPRKESNDLEPMELKNAIDKQRDFLNHDL
jgi:ribosomal protein L39E